MLSLLPLTLTTLFFLSDVIFAATGSSVSAAGQLVHLNRRNQPSRNTTEWGVWAKSQREALMRKYGAQVPQKRSTGTNLIVNQNADSSFFGSLAIGSPPISFDVILDTGSSDLWVADSTCHSGCSSVPMFNASASSTFLNETKPFSIQYGSGQAAGSIAQDIVQMAGFSVPNQVFGVVDSVSSGLLNGPVSGLMGLAWQEIAASGAAPFWETLASSGAWDSPLMAFQLTRFLNDSSAKTLEPGGSFTMGFVNDSLYTGNIDYQNIPSGQVSYWILSISSLTVQGKQISMSNGSSSYAAIDTGTTLVGGPSNAIQNIFAQVPGAQAGTGNWEGYYTYPCSTPVNVSISFGGPSWSVSPSDFQLTQISSSQCVGAFFEVNTGGSAPAWIIGDTFLKNVYSVFRYNPPSVGFATLSDTALAMNGVNAAVPSATIGSVGATVTATATGTSSGNVNSALPAAACSIAVLVMFSALFGAILVY